MARSTNWCEQSTYRAKWHKNTIKFTRGGCLQLDRWAGDLDGVPYRISTALVALDPEEIDALIKQLMETTR